jgi:hypothetical protein
MQSGKSLFMRTRALLLKHGGTYTRRSGRLDAPDGQSSRGHIRLDQDAFDKVNGMDRRSTSTAINRCKELGVCSVSKLFIIK